MTMIISYNQSFRRKGQPLSMMRRLKPIKSRRSRTKLNRSQLLKLV